MEHLSKHPNRGLSLLNQSNGVSKRSLYKSNAPELPENQIDDFETEDLETKDLETEDSDNAVKLYED